MKRNRLFLGAAWIAALLAVACAAATTRSENATARSKVLRSVVEDVVADPARRSSLIRSIDTMETAMLTALADNERLNRAFVEASADPAATLEELQAIADRVAAARRAGLRKLTAARIELRRGMTSAEWRSFASQLPAYDGGDQ